VKEQLTEKAQNNVQIREKKLGHMGQMLSENKISDYTFFGKKYYLIKIIR
jgi:hypothetical protein